MANKFVIDALISIFDNEISNEIAHAENKIIITLKDGTKMEITATNVS